MKVVEVISDMKCTSANLVQETSDLLTMRDSRMALLFGVNRLGPSLLDL